MESLSRVIARFKRAIQVTPAVLRSTDCPLSQTMTHHRAGGPKNGFISPGTAVVDRAAPNFAALISGLRSCQSCRAQACPRASLPRLFEISQVWRRLVFLGRHQEAVAAYH